MLYEVKMEYTALYSKRKTISITVRCGMFIVKAPIGTSQNKIEKLLSEHSNWIEVHLKKEREMEKLYSSLDEKRIKELRHTARGYFTEKTRYYADIMGLEYNKIRISSAMSRFASCSSRGNISYSYRLMLYSEACREYVIVHELAHLVEMNHSKKFWDIVGRYMPEYKKIREELKKVPQI